jgi:CrcB protein
VTALAVGLAGAVGALLRHALGVLAGPAAWPWPTLAINVAGSFLLGVVTTWGAARWPSVVTAAVGTGLLGAFTTYSTFSVQVVTLIREGRAGAATAYVALTLGVGVAAAAAGIALGAAFLPRR